LFWTASSSAVSTPHAERTGPPFEGEIPKRQSKIELLLKSWKIGDGIPVWMPTASGPPARGTPMEVQKEIVAEIEGYQKVIDGARAVLDNYRPHIPIQPDWPMVELGEVLTLQRGYDLPKQNWEEGAYPIVGSNGIIGFHAHYKEVGPGVVTGRSGTIGKVHFIDFDYYWPHNTSLFIKDFKGNDPKYLKLLLESIDLKSLGERTAAVPSLDRKNAHRVKVHLPPIPEQQAIVADIEAEQALVNANRELITRFEQKIQATLSRIWGEEKENAE